MSIVQLRWGANREKQPQGWSTQEIAEFYRIADIMARAGLRVEIDQGVTDEGEPWLVFVRPETDDVVAHFARIDGFSFRSALSHRISIAGATCAASSTRCWNVIR